ncbi:MAG: phage tail protein, partial [Pseudomonadota bacterium]
MRFTGLQCTADLVGLRVCARWGFELEGSESISDIPDVLLRKKLFDFEFPPLVPGDPYLVYDSAAFPPAPVPGSLAVVDLPTKEWVEGDMRITRSTVSVAAVSGPDRQEILRETRERRFDALGHLTSISVEVIDAADLTEGQTLYFELDDGSAPDPDQRKAYTDTAVPGAIHGHNSHLWELLPQVYRSGDTQQLPGDARVPGVLETSGRAGQLRRFVDMFGIGFDALRNSAEALEQIRDIDQAPPQFLELLGKGIGWLPSDAVTLPRRRNEVRNATRLYEVNGTPQSIGALVTQQTGWRSQVAELAESVTRANVAPSRSVYLQTEVTPPAGLPQWRGGLDSAAIFQFPSGLATGAGNNPASMDSAATEPFALFPGAELTIAIDGNVPVRIQFAKSDFADIGSASAAEIASVINRLMGDAEAEDQAGAVRITTLATGPQATLAVLPERQSLLSVSELPQGALAPVSHADGTIDLFFRDQQHPSPEVVQETEDPSRRSNRIFQKSWGHGMWRDAVPLPSWSDDVQDLDAAATADGRSLVLWLTGRQMKFSQGSAGAQHHATFRAP